MFGHRSDTERYAQSRRSQPVSGSRARCTSRAGPAPGAGAAPRDHSRLPDAGDHIHRWGSARSPGAGPAARASRWTTARSRTRRRPGLPGGGEGEPGPAGRVRPARPARRAGCAGCAGLIPGAAAPAAGGCGPCAAVPDGVSLAVGDGHAPGRAGAAGRGGGQVAGQVGVDEANPVHLAEMLAMAAPERVAAIPARVTDGVPAGNLVARVATRCRAELGDLCGCTRMALSDGQRTSGTSSRCASVARPYVYALVCMS